MDWAPIRMTYHIRTYRFGERLIPDLLGKMGMPEGTVKIRLHRIRGRLRERLTGEHD